MIDPNIIAEGAIAGGFAGPGSGGIGQAMGQREVIAAGLRRQAALNTLNPATPVAKEGALAGMLKNPQIKSMGLMMLASFLVKNIMSQMGDVSKQNLEAEGMENMASNLNSEDMYYQAMMPGLQQEQQASQDMLMQALLGGRGQQVQVPGERRI